MDEGANIIAALREAEGLIKMLRLQRETMVAELGAAQADIKRRGVYSEVLLAADRAHDGQINAMRPVVDAAKAWAEKSNPLLVLALMDAVETLAEWETPEEPQS